MVMCCCWLDCFAAANHKFVCHSRHLPPSPPDSHLHDTFPPIHVSLPLTLLTLFVTCVSRSIVGNEVMVFASELQYVGLRRNTPFFEIFVCVINVAWGLQGSWRTNETINRATFGF